MRSAIRWCASVAALGAIVAQGLSNCPAQGVEAPAIDAVKVEFTTSSATVDPGFTKDSGAMFTTATGTGWEALDGTPRDMTSEARRRTATFEPKWLGLVQTYSKTAASLSRWEATVANGRWAVTVGVGDASYLDSKHTVRAEGQTLLGSWVPSTALRFNTATGQVDVTDGRLTIDSVGGTNTKFNWIEATRLVPAILPPAAKANDAVWMYKPPVDGTSVETIASQYKRAILSPRDEAYRDQLVASGMADPIFYFRFDAVIDPGSTTAQPLRSQAAYNAGDYATLVRDHPDWFLRDSSGAAIFDAGPEGSEYIMDAGNPGWRAFFLDRLRSYYEANGWKGGVMLDNVETNLKKRIRKGAAPARYTTDLAYTDSIAGMLKYIHDGWTGPKGIPTIANMIEGNYSQADLDIRAKYLAFVDGMQHEAFGVTWSSGTWLSASRWDIDLKRIELVTSRGGPAIVFSQGDKADTAREQFALASYLLVKNDKSSFRYASSKVGYGYNWPYANYDARLGSPTGARYLSGSNWKRDFTNGFVSVDPVTHASSITVTK